MMLLRLAAWMVGLAVGLLLLLWLWDILLRAALAIMVGLVILAVIR